MRASSGLRAWMTRKCRLGRKKETWKVRGLRMRSVDTMSLRTWGQAGARGEWVGGWVGVPDGRHMGSSAGVQAGVLG